MPRVFIDDSDFTGRKPETPGYGASARGTQEAQAIDGRHVYHKDGVTVRQILDIITARVAFFHGIFLETFDALATSDGATVTMSLEQSGGGDLTMVFSDGHTVLDTTPATTIALTAGSDASPTENFIYILQSTKVLTKSTASWPTAEHIKVGYFLVPSAGFVQADGCYVNQNWNDHVQDSGSLGHLNHIVEAVRARSAIYKSGVVLTVTVGGGVTVDVAVTAGVVYQMHRHSTSATDTATGDKVLVVNQNGAAYDDVTDLETLTNDSTGAAVGKYFNWVIWGVVNKTGEFQPLMLNLPTGSYNQQSAAEGDVSGYDVLTIPAAFSTDSTTGFLIARVTMSKIGGTWAHVSTVDLRGAVPQTAVGGVGGVTTEFADNAFKLFDEGDNTKELVFQVSGISASTTRTITMPDQNVDLTPDTGSFIKNVSADSSPQLGGDLDRNGHDIVDASGNELVKFSVQASAINEITIQNGATGKAPRISATGDNPDINLELVPKGVGVAKVGTSVDTEVATIGIAQTFTNKTLTTPTIGDFTNAQHGHTNAAGGGQLASRDFIAELTRITPPAADRSYIGNIAGGSTPAENYTVWVFSGTETLFLDFDFVLSNNYTGGGLTVQIKTGCADNTGGEQTRWEAAIRRIADDAEIITAAHDYEAGKQGVSVDLPSAIGEFSYDDIVFTSGAQMDSLVAGEAFRLRLWRDHDHADDDPTEDAYLHRLTIRET